MSGIDLSSNRLNGDIPVEHGNLSEMQVLNLSHNNLMGEIPRTFSNLHDIECIDLSYNNLSGRIPHQLLELHSLAVFSVAQNNLSGAIPDLKGQFNTFDENSHEGNPFLCGPPLHIICRGTQLEHPFHSNSNENDQEANRDLLIHKTPTFFVCIIFFGFSLNNKLFITPLGMRPFLELCMYRATLFSSKAEKSKAMVDDSKRRIGSLPVEGQ
ncbi:hypothetical protein RND71_028392 [Anisodus tanguticus]|uniref:Uncharacterized protein n=1 Tax=Anisodus tanguticus TaxID=243964 RepID=A0AAE1RIC5_9SOLA|nr:hypothetical protein RND71_028392 [Anisodus tanguticus]